MVADKAFDQYKVVGVVRCNNCKKMVDESVTLKRKWDPITKGVKYCKTCFVKNLNELLNKKKYAIVPLNKTNE